MCYKLYKTFHGYAIAKSCGKWNVYVSNYYGGRFSWVTDHSHAKHFTLEIAKKHVKTLRGNCDNLKII